MTETTKIKDFVEINYTGKLADGTIFDTTLENVAKDNNNFNPKANYTPMKICIGEKQVLPGLDEQLKDKEIGKTYNIKLSAEKAFGKRDVKKVQLIPLASFKEHNLKPYPGLQVDFDGKMGKVMRVSGGRVMVNFNHPLSGKEIIYEIEIIKKIDNSKDKINAYLSNVFKQVEQIRKIEIEDNKATIKLPFKLPDAFSKSLSKKLKDLTNLKEIIFVEEKKDQKSETKQ